MCECHMCAFECMSGVRFKTVLGNIVVLGGVFGILFSSTLEEGPSRPKRFYVRCTQKMCLNDGYI